MAPMIKGTLAVRKEIIESGVSVYPQSVNIEPGVKMPLKYSQSPAILFAGEGRYAKLQNIEFK